MANTMDFDLDQAIEDFHFMCNWYGNYCIDYDYYAKCVVSAQLDDKPFNKEFFNECLTRVKLAIGGYQTEMKLN